MKAINQKKLNDLLIAETSPVEEHVLWPENGICAHTNHYLVPGKGFRDLKPLRDPNPSTYLRCRQTVLSTRHLKGYLKLKKEA